MSISGSAERWSGIDVKTVLESTAVDSNPNWLATRFDALINWAANTSRANSLWPMPFGTACCAIEFMATAASRFDLARFGMERMAFSPRQADVLICAGRLPFKLAAVIRRIYDNYAMVQGIDTVVPVDVYVPGCPPRPEGLLYGILLLQKKVKSENWRDRTLRFEEVLGEQGLRLPPEKVDEVSEPFGNSAHQFRSA